MMKKLLIIPALLLFYSACNEDSVVVPQPATLSTLESLIREHAPETQEFSFANETGTEITGKRGTMITILPYTYGNLPGKVLIRLREVYTEKEMLGSGIYTETADGRMLHSQGMFEARALRDGKEVLPLKDAVIRMNIRPGTTPDSTKVFELVEVKDTLGHGTEATQKWQEYEENWEYDPNLSNVCKFNFRLITWCNLDAYINFNTDNAVNIFPPPGFGAANTLCFFQIDGVNGLVELSAYRTEKKYKTMPVRQGLKGKVILLSAKDNFYHYKVFPVVFNDSPQDYTVQHMDLAVRKEIEELLEAF